jgi:hypothetical protein
LASATSDIKVSTTIITDASGIMVATMIHLRCGSAGLLYPTALMLLLGMGLSRLSLIAPAARDRELSR